MNKSMIKLCFIVNRSRFDSLPIIEPAAAATAIEDGEIILPTTPPEILAETVITGSTPMETAVVFCVWQNRALDDVSEPVTKTPSQPSTGAKKGNSTPVLDNTFDKVPVIPELFRI